MRIDREQARAIAALAHLEFDDQELDAIASEMTHILGYVDQLRESATASGTMQELAPTPMREDTPHACIERETVAANAPEWKDGFFVVPRVIGGE